MHGGKHTVQSSTSLATVATNAISQDENELQLLSIDRFAQQTETSPWTIRKHIRSGRLQSRLVFGCRRIPISELRRAVEQGI